MMTLLLQPSEILHYSSSMLILLSGGVLFFVHYLVLVVKVRFLSLLPASRYVTYKRD